jgi:uncharacterized membrane protein
MQWLNNFLSGCLLLMGYVSTYAMEPDREDPDKTDVYLYSCDGEDKSIIVTIRNDNGFLFSYQASQAMQRDPGSNDFRGEDVVYQPYSQPDLAPGQTAGITIKGRELQDCKNNPRAAVWEAAKLRGVDYRAIGQEPAWQLEISAEYGFLLILGYAADKLRFPYAEPLVDQAQKITRYTSSLQGKPIDITIKGQQCRDTMSGEAFSSRVEVTWQNKSLVGCGRALH